MRFPKKLPVSLSSVAVAVTASSAQARPIASADVSVNGRGETVSGIADTVSTTTFGEVVTSYAQGFIEQGCRATVDSITRSNFCPFDSAEHVSVPDSKTDGQIILNNLDPRHPQALTCYYQAPLTGSTNALGVI